VCALVGVPIEWLCEVHGAKTKMVEWSIVWLHPSVLTCSVYGTCLTLLVFCSCSFKRQKDVATPSCLIYTEDGEHHAWWDNGTPLTHSLAETLSAGVTCSVEPAENLRTWTRCSAEPPKPLWKVWLLLCVSVGPPDLSVFCLCLFIHIYPVSVLFVHPLKMTFMYIV
jgi:hypothetical protein